MIYKDTKTEVEGGELQTIKSYNAPALLSCSSKKALTILLRLAKNWCNMEVQHIVRLYRFKRTGHVKGKRKRSRLKLKRENTK